MAERSDRDEIEGQATPKSVPTVNSAATLPLNEQARPLATQRTDLMRKIEELEGTLRYMGSIHPRRPATQTQLQQLKDVLQRVEAELAAAPKPPRR